MTFVSYAQNFEDVLLWRVFKHQGPGFYIDVGAAHPDTDSVTRAFYDRGWHGVNIEPVPEFFQRIEAARPRDINLRVALGQSAGQADFFVVPGTGLSTLDGTVAEACRAQNFEVNIQSVEVTTLAEICRQHVQGDIHFLKIDVEGAEHIVLAGADLRHFRPWLVVVEATAPMSTVPTHDMWEPGLLASGYRFVWFDGLNRFYAAEERYDELAGHFQVPVNVFDDALRASDTEAARRIATAESQAADLLERAVTAEATNVALANNVVEERIRGVEGRLKHADAQAQAAGTRAFTAESRLNAELQEKLHREIGHIEAKARLQTTLMQEQASLAAATGEIVLLRHQAKAASDLAASYLTSTSWRLTAPVRLASIVARGLVRRARSRRVVAPPAPAALPAPVADEANAVAPLASARPASRPIGLRRSVHQFHSGSAVGDAITNSMLLVQRQLRAMGYRSEIYVEHRDVRLEGVLRLLDEIPAHDEYVLIAHHSMGFDAFERVAALPAPKILMYHNITPASLFADMPVLQDYSHLGRAQLARWRPLATAALADSAYNAIELQRLGFEPVAVCTMLFDIANLHARAAARQPRRETMFTILFVGRVIASKAQSDLIAAYASFRRQFEGASRLVIVGAHDGAGEAYYWRLQTQISELGLGADVVVTGRVSDDALYAWYGEADLYVSLSHHEGFGVPLIEAMALGVPVLAWPAGAVPYTVAGGGEILQDRAPEPVAARMLALARDPALRARMAESGRATIERFALAHQIPALRHALTLAGAAPPPDPAAAALLADHLCFTVTGHLAGSYSLAGINRDLCLTLETAFPGRVRALPVLGELPNLSANLPDDARAEILRLVGRAAHDTGPEIVVSQHYPVLVPDHRGDVLLAMFFWEESLIPQTSIDGLNGSFSGVLAPSQFVAKALVDSGLSIPVTDVGLAPDLSRFAALERRPNAAAPFTFLHVSSCFPRKGIPALLAAYVGAFRRSDPVRLVIKGFPNPHNDAAAQVAAIQHADPDAPAIEMVDRDLAPAALLALYEAADAMVLPTHGEGFNLPAAEALACGMELIVTGHGGHMDFCDATNARLVDFRFAPSTSHLASAGSVWVEPDVADLSAALKEAATRSPDTLARAKAGRESIAQRLTGRPFAHRVARAAVASLLMPPDRDLHVAFISSWGVRCGVAAYSRFLVEAMRQAEPSLRVTILADKRSTASPAGHDGEPTVVPAWQAGAREACGELRQAIGVADPDAILVQHQPGLIPWSELGTLLQDLARADRPLTVTLHNTRHLLDVDETERRSALDGLALASRIIVHTVADLNLLKPLGLISNVLLLPQGAPAPSPVRLARSLSQGQAAVIGCCGFFLPGKGIGQLIEAMALVQSRWPRAMLRLVNADYGSVDSAAEIAACRAAAEAAGIEQSIEWNTAFLPIEQLHEKLAGCDLVVLPYQDTKEASSAALRTALGAGVCVAVTPIPIFDEAAQAVFRLPGTAAADIAAGVEALLADQALRTRTQENAARWLDDRAWSGIGRRTLGMLRGLGR